MPKHLGLVLAALVALGSLLVWVMGISADAADTKSKIGYVEKRQEEDRKDTRASIQEVKEHVRIIDGNVQIILQTVKSMEAVQRADRRRE